MSIPEQDLPPIFVEKRPTRVTVIGWFYIAVGSFVVICASLGIVQIAVAGGPPAQLIRDAEQASQVVAFVFRHYLVVAAVQFFLGASTVWIAVRFLQMKSWARTALELMSWVPFIASVAFTVMDLRQSWELWDWIGQLVCCILSVMPWALIVLFLRTRKVRIAMGSANKLGISR